MGWPGPWGRMSIAVAFDEQELSILQQSGMPPARYGIPRGTWFWTGAALGDASGGNVGILFFLTERVKTDWVLSLVLGSMLADDAVTGGVRLTWNSGPIFRDPLVTGVTNPSWREAATVVPVSLGSGFTPAMSMDERLVAVGEPKIAGSFTVAEWVRATNTDGTIYQVAMWGLLYDWRTFYRGAPPQSPL